MAQKTLQRQPQSQTARHHVVIPAGDGSRSLFSSVPPMQQDSDYSANGDAREKFFNFAKNIADFGNMIHQQCNIFAGVDGARSHRSCLKIRVICSILKASNIRMHYRGEDFFLCFFDCH
jgi:hypothetical protein